MAECIFGRSIVGVDTPLSRGGSADLSIAVDHGGDRAAADVRARSAAPRSNSPRDAVAASIAAAKVRRRPARRALREIASGQAPDVTASFRVATNEQARRTHLQRDRDRHRRIPAGSPAGCGEWMVRRRPPARREPEPHAGKPVRGDGGKRRQDRVGPWTGVRRAVHPVRRPFEARRRAGRAIRGRADRSRGTDRIDRHRR